MSKYLKFIALAVLLIFVILGSYFLYNALSENYREQEKTPEVLEESKKTPAKKDYPMMNAPDFIVLNEKGEETSLSDYLGKPIVVNFWATWCYYCKEEMPDFNKAFKEYPDVQFVMVNLTDGNRETIEKANAFIEEMGYEFPIFFDTKYDAAMNYQVMSIPATFFIDKNGDLVAKNNGMIDYETLVQNIEKIK